MKLVLFKTDQNHPLIKAYKQAVEKGKKNQHVLFNNGLWAVKRADAVKASQIFKTQGEAITHAIALAQNQKTSLFIHGEDGLIRERRDF